MNLTELQRKLFCKYLNEYHQHNNLFPINILELCNFKFLPQKFSHTVIGAYLVFKYLNKDKEVQQSNNCFCGKLLSRSLICYEQLSRRYFRIHKPK